MPENNLSLRNKIIDSIKSTLESSSIHAIPNIVRTEYVSLKLFWFVCFLISSAGLGYFMSLTISDYLTWPVITSIQINQLQKLTFPIVTICSLNGFTSLPVDLINICMFSFKSCTQNEDFDAVDDPFFGKCLRFNSGKSMNGSEIPLKSSGKGTTLLNVLELNLLKDNDEKSSINFFNENGFVVFISNETVDSTVNTGIRLLTGTSTHIKLNRYTIIKQPKPYSNCFENLTSPDSYDSECYKKTIQKSQSGNYHYTDCKNMCLQKLIGDRCNFQVNIVGKTYYDNMLAHIPKNVFPCFLDSATDFSSSLDFIEACDCPIECQTTGFSYSTSISYLYTGKSPAESSLGLRIYFEESSETIVSEDPKYKVADLISNLGGTIGLFTGFSFLSLIEIVEILANIGFILYENKQKKKIEPIVDLNKKISSVEIDQIKLDIFKSLLNIVIDLSENKIKIKKIDSRNLADTSEISQNEMARILENMGYIVNENI